MALGRYQGAFSVVLLLFATAAPARGGENPTQATTVPNTEVRALVGLGLAVEGEQLLWAQRLRVSLGAHALPWTGWIDGAVSLRVLADSDQSLWLRGGWMGQRTADDSCKVDRAMAWDLGAQYRRHWAGGTWLGVGAGVERVTRDGSFYCRDSVLDAVSSGARVDVAARWPMTRLLGFYARLGVRTGQHVLEIGVLPEAWIGLSVAFDP